MSYDFFAQQGWQCPICKRIYSPFTLMCFYCGNAPSNVMFTNSTDYLECPVCGRKVKKGEKCECERDGIET